MYPTLKRDPPREGACINRHASCSQRVGADIRLREAGQHHAVGSLGQGGIGQGDDPRRHAVM